METPVNTTLRTGWVWREKEAGEGRRGFLLPSFAACVLSIDAQRTNHAKQQKSHSASQALNTGHSVNRSAFHSNAGVKTRDHHRERVGGRGWLLQESGGSPLRLSPVGVVLVDKGGAVVPGGKICIPSHVSEEGNVVPQTLNHVLWS